MSRTFDVVFQGGGARGIVLNGALETLERRGHRHRRLVGTSAGAIAASLAAAGFSGAELAAMSRQRRSDGLPEFAEYVMEPPGPPRDVRSSGVHQALMAAERSLHIPQGVSEMVADQLSGWLDRIPMVRNVFSFVEQGGVHSGRGFVAWLSRTLESKRAGLSTVTLGALAELTGRDLTIIAADTTAAEMLVLNHRTAPRLPLVSAVRMSMSIPLFFEEMVWLPEWGPYAGKQIDGHVVVDGGVLSNFPLRFVLPEGHDELMTPLPPAGARPLGLHIDPTASVAGAPPSTHSPTTSPLFTAIGHSRVAQRVFRLVETMLDGNDDTIEEGHRSAICPLPAKGYFATEFHMEPARVEALLAAGASAMGRYLDRLEEAS